MLRSYLTFWLLAMLVPAHAEDFICATNGASITILGYTGTAPAVAVPATISDLPVVAIGSGAFRGVQTLRSVTLPDSVTNVGAAAFADCTALTNAIVGHQVTALGVLAFADCVSLVHVALGNGLQSIGAYAFMSCQSLTHITIPAAVSQISDEAFEDCRNLAAIDVVSGNGSYSSLDGVLFNRNRTTLLTYPSGRAAASYAVPTGVTGIGSYAFYGAQNLTTVTLPGSVTHIDAFAFYDCAVTAMYFEGNAPDLGYGALSASQATVYGLPGTSGWSTNYGGAPVGIWQPRIEAPSCGSVQFGFEILWAADRIVLVEACTDLVNPVWMPIALHTLPGGSSRFNDPDRGRFVTRFYRVRAL